MQNQVHQKIPRSVGIIMDGNGRWAQSRGRPRFFGHVRGSSRVEEIVRAAADYGVQALTLYAFSTENWKRPEAEREVLWKLLVKHLRRQVPNLMKQNVRLRVMGELDRLPVDAQEEVSKAVATLAQNTGLVLTFAVSYGSRREIVSAAQRWSDDLRDGKAGVTEEDFSKYLWTSDMGELADLDLLVRTSDEKRISNFLLWQAAYAELVFVPEHWPDFTAERFHDVMKEYSKRDRRMGAVQSSKP